MAFSPFVYAARQPLALAVFVFALLGGVFIAFWLLPLGLLIYGTMIWLAVQDPALRREASTPQRERLTSPTFKAQMDRIERTAQDIQHSVAKSPGALGRLLSKVGSQASDLTEEAHTLCDKGQIIESYLTSVNQGAVQKQIEAIDIRLRSTQDPYTRDQLGETRKALTDRQSNASDLETYIGRINAQLQNIEANLNNVLAEIVRLRTSDAASADVATNQVAQRLSDLKSDMDAFQQVLDTALTQTQVGA